MKTMSQSAPRNSSRLGILGSTQGTDLQAIIGAIKQGRLDASVAVVISNKRDAYILERARKHDILTMYVEGKERSRKNFDDEVSTILKQNCVDLVLLIGYMRILSSSLTFTLLSSPRSVGAWTLTSTAKFSSPALK